MSSRRSRISRRSSNRSSSSSRRRRSSSSRSKISSSSISSISSISSSSSSCSSRSSSSSRPRSRSSNRSDSSVLSTWSIALFSMVSRPYSFITSNGWEQADTDKKREDLLKNVVPRVRVSGFSTEFPIVKKSASTMT